jgi:hypothetical protein
MALVVAAVMSACSGGSTPPATGDAGGDHDSGGSQQMRILARRRGRGDLSFAPWPRRARTSTRSFAGGGDRRIETAVADSSHHARWSTSTKASSGGTRRPTPSFARVHAGPERRKSKAGRAEKDFTEPVLADSDLRPFQAHWNGRRLGPASLPSALERPTKLERRRRWRLSLWPLIDDAMTVCHVAVNGGRFCANRGLRDAGPAAGAERCLRKVSARRSRGGPRRVRRKRGSCRA